MDKNFIKKARQTNLGEYLIYKGEPIKKSGTRYRHLKHDSLVFTQNSFYWNSRNEKGNSIDFLMLYYGMDFISAVNELLDYLNLFPKAEYTPQKKETFDFSKLCLDKNGDNVIAYLSEKRMIDRELIISLVQNSYIFQECGTNNILFPMYDEKQNIVGAEVHGSTTDGRYKGIYKNSKYGYGFNISHGIPEKIYFFESAIDLISFMEIAVKNNKNLNQKCFVSMGGLKDSVIKRMSGICEKGIILCVDSDTAGRNFAEKVKKLYPNTRDIYPPKFKDWNEYLQSEKGLKTLK